MISNALRIRDIEQRISVQIAGIEEQIQSEEKKNLLEICASEVFAIIDEWGPQLDVVAVQNALDAVEMVRGDIPEDLYAEIQRTVQRHNLRFDRISRERLVSMVSKREEEAPPEAQATGEALDLVSRELVVEGGDTMSPEVLQEGTDRGVDRGPTILPPTTNIGSAFKYKLGLGDMLRAMEVKIVRQDRLWLYRKLRQKLQEPDLVNLIQNISTSEEKDQYLLLARLSRFVVGDRIVACTAENLIQVFPDMFAQIKEIEKYENMPFFIKDTPQLEWAIVTVEALEESKNLSFSAQNVFLKKYAERNRSTESRVRRRTFVEAIFDAIALSVTTDKNILSKMI